MIKQGGMNVVYLVYAVIMSCMFSLSLLSFVLEPYGKFLLSYKDLSISSTAIMAFTFSILVLIYSFRNIEPFWRTLCTIAMPVFGVAINEMMFHYGIYRTWCLSESQLVFWVSYSIMTFGCVYYLHYKYSILRVTRWSIILFLPLLVVYLMSWNNAYSETFYHAVVAFCRNQGPDPHKPIHHIVAAYGNLILLVFSRAEIPGMLKGVKTVDI